MNLKLRKLALACVGASLLTIAGCGGGGGGGSAGGGTPVSPPAASTTSVPVTVIDGAIQNATVCLDQNNNGLCDSGEPSGRTDAAGNVSLQVPTADAGKYPILAMAGTDSVDADHGTVTVPFTMKAPADKPAVVSPLTTLVQSLIESSGSTSAQAEASVKAQLGVNVSLFDDFTKGTSADSQAAGTVARMVVVTTQQQSSALAGAVGAAAIDGAVITQAHLDQIIQKKLLEILPALLSALADPSVQAATTPAAKEAALLAQASALVASPSTGLTTSSVATLVAINNQTSTPAGTTTVADTPTASANLRALRFSDAQNWFSRVFSGTIAQNTPDASDNTRYVDRRNNSVASAVASWNVGGSPNRQSDLHFNGTAWVNCGLNFESTQTVRDAKGNSSYDYCDKLETGSSNRAVFDIAGRTMIDVYNQITAAGYTNLSINSAATVLGSATFPADSKLFYVSSTPISTAVAYYPGTGNTVSNANANVAAGRTSPSDTTAACASISSTTPTSSYRTAATSLESLIAANQGTPCVNNPNSVVVSNGAGGTTTVASGSRNEWWSQSTESIGTLGTASVGGTQTTYYTTNTLLRVGFGADNTVKYYSCRQRSTDGSVRNCDLIGTGSYTITTLGDGRTLTLSNPPLLASGLGYQRVFVERGGKVYYGYQNNITTTNTARLNLAATNALFGQLGLPSLDPNTPLALTKTSYAGDWLVSDHAGGPGVTTVSIAANGSVNCSWTDGTNFDPVHACSLSFSNLATGAFTLVDDTITATGTVNFLTGAVSGTWNDPSSTVTSGSFVGARR